MVLTQSLVFHTFSLKFFLQWRNIKFCFVQFRFTCSYFRIQFLYSYLQKKKIMNTLLDFENLPESKASC